MYSKLFTKILDSSIWMESDNVRLVWITMLAMKDEDGMVALSSIHNVAHRARVSLEAAEEAIKVLESPDKINPNQPHEGRRIERIGNMWMVLNAKEYDAIARREQMKEKNREYVRLHREKKAGKDNVRDCKVLKDNERKSKTLDIDIDTDSEIDSDIKEIEPLTPKGEVAPKVATELPFNSIDFQEAWKEWVQYRKEIKHPLKPMMIKSQFKDFKEWGEDRTIAAIHHTISKGWQGLQEPNQIFFKQNHNTSYCIPEDK
jgi:hypothetical protein